MAVVDIVLVIPVSAVAVLPPRMSVERNCAANESGTHAKEGEFEFALLLHGPNVPVGGVVWKSPWNWCTIL